MVDELPYKVNCEELSARLDNFINELGNRPDATGYAVIAVNPTKPGGQRYLERYIDGYPRYRGFDETRLDVIRVAGTDGNIKSWLVPLGAEFEVPLTKYDYQSDERKTEVYSDTNEQGPCYTGPPFRLLSRYLKSNPNVVANMAIGSPSKKNHLQTKTEIAKRFFADYAVPTSRVHFFRIPGRFYSNAFELRLVKRK